MFDKFQVVITVTASIGYCDVKKMRALKKVSRVGVGRSWNMRMSIQEATSGACNVTNECLICTRPREPTLKKKRSLARTNRIQKTLLTSYHRSLCFLLHSHQTQLSQWQQTTTQPNWLMRVVWCVNLMLTASTIQGRIIWKRCCLCLGYI